MNRHQNDLKLLATDAKTGSANLLYQETNKYFVEIIDDWWWLKDGKNFMFTSEMSGYRHLYLYSLDGKTKTQLTKGNFEVTDVNAVDEVNKRIYYTMAYPRPMDRSLFVTDFAGKKTYQLTQGEGWHRVEFNDAFTQFYDFRSDINTPQVVSARLALRPPPPPGESGLISGPNWRSARRIRPRGSPSSTNPADPSRSTAPGLLAVSATASRTFSTRTPSGAP